MMSKESNELTPMGGGDITPQVEESKILNIGGDQVIEATKELPEEHREPIRWLFFLAKGQGWNGKRLGRETEIDSTTLARVFTGTYPAKLDKIVSRIEKYRATFEDQAIQTQEFYIETSIYQQIKEGLDYARNSHTMVFFYGRTQIGKTAAQLYYKNLPKNNHGKTKYVRMPASAGVQLMMKEFARSCFVSPNSCFENLREYVFNAIDGSMLLTIDEVHQVFMSYLRGSAIKCLEVIRELHDRRGCGMGLFGTQKLHDELMMGSHIDLLEQFKERGIVEIFLPPNYPKEDLAKIAAHFGLGAPTGKAAEIVQEVTKGHGLKRYVLFLKSAQNLATNKKQRTSWEHFIRAYDIVANLRKGAR